MTRGWLDRVLGRERGPASALGRRGERLAGKHLKRAGYRVLARNLRTPTGEADLVCLAPDRRTVVVVEVKTRVAGQGPAPEESVTAHKRRKLAQVAESIASRRGVREAPIRVDVIGIELDGHGHVVALRHHEDAVSQPRRARAGS